MALIDIDEPQTPTEHPFVQAPHRTLLALAIPALFSLVAEPLTGLVDTAFVSSLGSAPLAALGVGTIALSSVFWAFNFLGIGSQTEVSQAMGRRRRDRAAQISGLALAMSGGFGLLLILLGWATADWLTAALGATGQVQTDAVAYVQVRLFGAPAVLATIAAFGVLRGLQDMRTPLWIALGMNGLNIALDGPLIFGLGPAPAFGVAGAAWASIISQWVGAVWAIVVVIRRLGIPSHLNLSEATALLKIGGDIFLRTGTLTLFLLLTTRAATRISADGGAAHQAVRQVWLFSALFLDAYALSGQSLVGYFVGADWLAQARRVAAMVCLWSVATGAMLGAVMWLSQSWVIWLLVPPPAVPLFIPAWWIAAATQPINALAFATDGLHWGTSDYRFLRNAMLLATAGGVATVLMIDTRSQGALTLIWLATGGWLGLRAVLGVIRIWPGVGRSPFTAPRRAMRQGLP